MNTINEVSLLISADEYVRRREKYDYSSPDCKFKVIQTGTLSNTGEYIGIFPKEVSIENPSGINLRKFENIVREIFLDCYNALNSKGLSQSHIENLKQISSAIIYWKMASQGGRAKTNVKNLQSKWNKDTPIQLLNAYTKKDISLFKIGGVRIPTATAFIRFLFPDDFGIMDSRVVGNYTQRNGITTLSVRNDGYINDTKQNTLKYNTEYISFLRKEADYLNKLEIKFNDIDAQGNMISTAFRVCDVEMALF